MKRIALLVLALSTTAGAASVTLQAGQTGALGNKQITVVRVQDNRCPINARCIRAGELIVKVLVKQNGKLRFLTLQDPPAPNSVWPGLGITGAPGRATNDRRPVKITFTDAKL